MAAEITERERGSHSCCNAKHHEILRLISNSLPGAALMSAKANAPSVVPHLIISDTGEVNARRFLSWWEANGGMVHRWNLSFYPRLHSAVHEKKWHDAGWLSQYGTYLKVDIPLIIKERIQAPGKMVGDISETHVLNTDAE